MTQEVLTDVTNTTGVITLNRPRALNSLNPAMVRAIAEAIAQWRDDPRVEQVIIESSSPKAFCAGGDVRFAREEILAGRQREVDEFFALEYQMNKDLAAFPRPLIALVGGVVMGGGLGVSAHGSHLVVTDAAFASMPEMAIGFNTDVGMSHVFQTLRDSPALGRFLALTGWRLNPAEMMWAGLATNYVGDRNLGQLRDRLIDAGPQALIDAAATPDPATNRLAGLAADIEAVFAADTYTEILSRLESFPQLARVVGELTAKANPTSLVATAALCAVTVTQDLPAAIDTEARLGEALRREPNFAEGVRAVLVDKTQDAQFSPATVEQVDAGAYQEILRACS
ncbi:3-hydroxyisobutyryl-CoA hydrolase [Corynebacterium uberis]|uniref:3-hydroxyisobutyryl-CoA hydrolase n=1 Tax=Corynebacterium TaxID=1716 RepID=UPI001D09BAA6|nr:MULTISPECIES: 3-hydroxyisobutyryl-CoA hydrolase [Corynebacterium]MCZ9308810.1 3-hydroxyisobutyryl-CoA hydrolase [Corynebacterium sp. c6VSa_13]UDL72662.1 enoyl-CoA hydratase/isomerase family protein [Corynebacterium uberis]UDL76462.1 enoyl-CoA hydratase/isomerase family protein [Corynebacterium uberis]UDL78674.1 enoyl-CoA hydratase/isomerase family protein [Corynebacterium uberis]UDL80953.1 enoyl-CoA hydratase/isomerase family protein [Corynebacterium uberis]